MKYLITTHAAFASAGKNVLMVNGCFSPENDGASGYDSDSDSDGEGWAVVVVVNSGAYVELIRKGVRH